MPSDLKKFYLKFLFLKEKQKYYYLYVAH